MKTLLAALFATGVSMSALAAEYKAIVPEKSTVSFTSRQMGVPVEGRFGKFAVTVSFDPALSEKGKASIEIDLASIDAGSKDANDEVASKPWFNVREFPKASFVTESIKPMGGNRYEARGKMTIKGKTRDMIVPFTHRQEGIYGVIEGVIPVMRTQFGVGEGPWGDTSVVADEVPVKFKLIATPMP